MKRSFIRVGIISSLTLSIVGGAFVFAKDNLSNTSAPSSYKIRELELPPPPRPEGNDKPRTQAAEAPANRNTTSPKTNPPTGGNGAGQTANTVVITGGFDTDPQDKGRPVVLIAAALGVPTEVFREAFSGVKPAGLDRGPTAEEAQKNKAALLKVLAPYGITNQRLDEVSNYYRYNGSSGGTWPRTEATATVTVTNGVVTSVTVTNPGSGYTSSPTISVMGPNGQVTAAASLSYSKDFKTNGSISAINIQ
ncbi:hypothetical protein [Paenibacillus sp. N3.4]|uniref:hypothetical protein n=1 Tax=Paenibacillus sp. N3.4 TaxID=2603222 RepID=UPI0011CBC032|nr:hypothetical protein [Paenibacillus sp. N3.4]TXK71775.1 hypothetical protein FU659_32605 [Paenibacillus sp. N3.4]